MKPRKFVPVDNPLLAEHKRFLSHLEEVTEDRPHPRSYRPDLPLRFLGPSPLGTVANFGVNAATTELYAWASAAEG